MSIPTQAQVDLADQMSMQPAIARSCQLAAAETLRAAAAAIRHGGASYTFVYGMAPHTERRAHTRRSLMVAYRCALDLLDLTA